MMRPPEQDESDGGVLRAGVKQPQEEVGLYLVRFSPLDLLFVGLNNEDYDLRKQNL